MKYTVTILDARTGDHSHVRLCDNGKGDEEDIAATVFMWEEGNYSCDCNRSLFFRRGCGEDVTTTGYEHTPCSDGRFRIVSIITDDGKTIYSEMDS